MKNTNTNTEARTIREPAKALLKRYRNRQEHPESLREARRMVLDARNFLKGKREITQNQYKIGCWVLQNYRNEILNFAGK